MMGNPAEAGRGGEGRSLVDLFNRRITITGRFWFVASLLAFNFFFAVAITCWPARPKAAVLGFHEAVIRGDYTIVQYHLSRNPRLANEVDGSGLYPIELVSLAHVKMYAYDVRMEEYRRANDSGESRAKIAGLLLDFGAASGPGWNHNPGALEEAIEGDWPATVKLFLQREGAHISQVQRERALGRAIGCGNAEIVEMMLDYDANVNADRMTSLLWDAIQPTGGWKTPGYEPSAAVVRVLISRGANINFRGPGRTTIIHHAAQRSKYDYAPRLSNLTAIEELIADGADVNAIDDQGRTPLHIAAVNGNHPLMKLLISHGAREDVKDRDGKTPADLLAAQAK